MQKMIENYRKGINYQKKNPSMLNAIKKLNEDKHKTKEVSFFRGAKLAQNDLGVQNGGKNLN